MRSKLLLLSAKNSRPLHGAQKPLACGRETLGLIPDFHRPSLKHRALRLSRSAGEGRIDSGKNQINRLTIELVFDRIEFDRCGVRRADRGKANSELARKENRRQLKKQG